MIGERTIRIFNRRVDYQFTLKCNITVIQGDSGSGKTTLFEMVAEHARLGQRSGVQVCCDAPCISLSDSDWRHQLRQTHDSIVFVDEGREFVNTRDFASLVNGSSNYFVLFYREGLHQLAYSINEIYEFKMSGKYHTLAPVYKPGKNCVYGTPSQSRQPYTCLVCEDSHSGFQFYDSRFKGSDMHVESAGTKSAIHSWITEHLDGCVFVVANGAAFGDEANRVMAKQKEHPERVTVCLPESFEWLILASGLVAIDGIDNVLERTQDFVDSSKYKSWEQFYADYLARETQGTPFAYRKSSLNAAYAVPENAERILKTIEDRNVK